MSRLIPSRLTALHGLLLVTAVLLGSTVLPRFAPFVPDLVLPVVVAGGLRGGRSTGVLLGLAGGWMVDLVPPGTGTVGLSALVYAAAGALAGSAHRALRHSPALPAITVLGGALVAHGAGVVHDLLQAQPLDLAGAGWGVLATTLIGALLVPPLVAHQQHLVKRGRS